ncbi:N-acetylmuramoyl-L-alanine amidase [Microbulbifer pacificus]|uniref:peptidoglycan recognition protein family protein n=1 Tax=Microbulbifer pacificus TaxID=407164 RepID=UPI0018F87684|nr:peptidoglycan recognition family protein [Microbulbifer pacificus]
MAKIVDLRGKTMGGRDKRTKVTKIARHHSATADGNYASFAKYWGGTKGWNTGGYHEIILRDGTVQLCYDWDTVTNGVYGHNQNTYHICLVGNGSFTDAQEKAFEERAKAAIALFRLRVSDVQGHNEFSGTNTSCPGINMNTVRSRLNGESVSPAPKPQTKPSKTSSNKANLTVDGKWGNSTTTALQKALGTTQDGIISDQLSNSITNAFYGTTIDFGNGKKGSMVVKALQGKVGSKQDGLLGPNTIGALQKHLGTPYDKKLSRPSTVVKELQRRLNASTF